MRNLTSTEPPLKTPFATSVTATPAKSSLARRSFAARKTLTEFLHNPKWFVMFTLGRFRMVSDLAVLSKRRTIQPFANKDTLFCGLDPESILEELYREGLYSGINLDDKTTNEIAEFGWNNTCYWPENKTVQFLPRDRAKVEREVGKTVLLGRYFDIEERCEAVRKVAHDPLLHHIAAVYMGAEPAQIETRLWWSFCGEASQDDRLEADQGFHYDLHDYRSMAFYFHLTDVDEFSGPHICVLKSHHRKPLRKLLSTTRQSSEEEIVKHYGKESIVAISGKPGFGFAEDPFSYHRGSEPLNRDRLMLRVRFTVNDDGTRVDRSNPAKS